MILSLLVLLLAALLSAPLATAMTVSAQESEPVVRFYLFYSQTCPHCHEIMENYLPTVYEKYGNQVEYEYVDIYNNQEAYLTMLALEQSLGLPESEQGYVPTLIIGDKVIVGGGPDGIEGKLEGYIDEYLAQGGIDLPSLENLPTVVVPTPAPAVEVLVFVDPRGADVNALNTLMSTLAQQYPNQFLPYGADVTTAEVAAARTQLTDAMGLEPLPEGTQSLLIDHRLLVEMDEIQAELPGLIEEYLAQGGISIPPWDEMVGDATPVPTAQPEATVGPGGEPIYLAYFEQAGCQECARTTYDLDVIKAQYPQLVVEQFSIEEPDNKALNEWLSDKYGVPEEERLSTPMIFVGDDVLIGTEAILQPMLAAVSKYATTGAERTWEDFDPEAGREGILDRFRNFGVLTVLGAGLIDGLNPCAFATLVFFISYMAFTGRRGRDILIVGVTFALGVFLTYLLVGVGLLKLIQSLDFFTSLGRWVYLLTALLCTVLAMLTLRDYGRAREGKVTEMTLKLPMSLRRQINKVIREGAQVQAFGAMAFVTGFVVSLIELACTGQVYLPTIVYVLSQPDLAAQAFLYLVFYCLMFVLPLVVVFVLAYFGTTSEQLGQFVNRHTALIKLATGVIFVGLALWMTWTLAPLFGIQAPWIWVLLGLVVVAVAVGAIVLDMTGRRRAPAKKVPTGGSSHA
ncbi:MAG: hypothetical protein JXA93_18800 [Anaerolineae bacterium]|nr:hypothetical protein [Anaerolineae bacterium]